MKDNIPTLNTIDDLINAALKSGDTRFKLMDDVNMQYDDPAIGLAWETERDEFLGAYPTGGSYKDPEKVAWRQRKADYDDTMPNKHPVKTYRLRKEYDTYYLVGSELGIQIDAIWTKKKATYGTGQERTGLLTLSGILKRMGRADIATKIKDAETLRKEQDAKNRQNNIRASLRRKWDELEKWVKDYGAEIGVTPEMFQFPVELADALKEES